MRSKVIKVLLVGFRSCNSFYLINDGLKVVGKGCWWDLLRVYACYTLVYVILAEESLPSISLTAQFTSKPLLFTAVYK